MNDRCQDDPAANIAVEALLLTRLAGVGRVALVGGWFDELMGLSPPRPHSDVDLLVTDPDLDLLDQWLVDRDEIIAKRFGTRKRAFLLRGVMVELILVWSGEDAGERDAPVS